MLDTLKTILSSKRFNVALSTAIFEVTFALGYDVSEEKLLIILGSVTALAATLIASFTSTDKVLVQKTAMGLDHKGKKLEK